MGTVARSILGALAFLALLAYPIQAQTRHTQQHDATTYHAEHTARLKRHHHLRTHSQRLHNARLYGHEHRARVKRHHHFARVHPHRHGV